MPIRGAILDPLSLRGLTARYLLALGLVATLSCSAYLALRQTIRAQESAAAVVNVSGRQRMLSQRIAFHAQRLSDELEAADPVRDRLRQAIAEMATAHRDLLAGNPQRHLPGAPSPTIQAMYLEPPLALDRLVAVFLGHASAVLAQAGPVPIDDPDLRAVIELADDRLLTALDAIVERYQLESEAEVALLLRAETLVVGLTLATLLAEALFIFRPMIARVVAERDRLIEAEARTRAVVDSCHDGILTVGAAGVVTSANPAAAALFRSTAVGLIGRRFDQLVADRRWLDAVMARTVDGGMPDGGVRSVAATRDDGSDFVADLAVSTMRRNQERMAVVILRESTEQLQLDARRLERINRELDQFAYVTSHDLKAPLRAIANLATWIEEDLGTAVPPSTRTHLALLRSRVLRLEALIDGIRDYAATAGAAGEIETIDLAVLVQEVFEDQAHDRPFQLRVVGPLPRIQSDRTLLWQVFANLLANAIKHHHRDHGTITVSCSESPDGPRFTVSDDGPGIPVEHREKVFVIFQTLRPKDRDGGLGLGLALVKKIIGTRGGEVAIGEAVGGGTAVSFTWPHAEAVRS